MISDAVHNEVQLASHGNPRMEYLTQFTMRFSWHAMETPDGLQLTGHSSHEVEITTLLNFIIMLLATAKRNAIEYVLLPTILLSKTIIHDNFL